MEKTKEERRTHPPCARGLRERTAVIHRRRTDDRSPYVPKIRVVGEVNVRELLGRDIEDDESIDDTHS
jgi:hypothetical protein